MKKKIMNDYVCMRRGLSKVHTLSKHKTLNATGNDEEKWEERGRDKHHANSEQRE